MANFKMDGLDEFMKALNEIGNSAEEIAKKSGKRGSTEAGSGHVEEHCLFGQSWVRHR